MSLCHDVELNVEIVMARSRERGEMSKLHALEPRALIPRAHANKQKEERKTDDKRDLLDGSRQDNFRTSSENTSFFLKKNL